MKIVYNPTDGAPITAFIFNKVLLNPLYPDGFKMNDGTFANGLMKFDDEACAQELLDTFIFLKEITPNDAKEIINRPREAAFACDFPGCDFTTTAKIGLEGHKRKHKGQIAEQPQVDELGIPVATGKKVLSSNEIAERQKAEIFGGDDISEVRNGKDADGVSWYGEGLTQDNPSFNNVRKVGKGHFAG